jgi:hypothetical protein
MFARKRLLPSCAVSVPVVIDLIWHAGYYFQEDLGTRANWAGFMQDVCVSTNRHPVSDIRMLPIIDLNPNDMSCIFSTLTFLEKQAKLLSMETACVTFDQPLYIKAVEIAESSKMDVVCRLGGFHLLMNFLGAIGTIMAGSGLVEALQTCYGPVALSHMMTGKAYAKAVRAHILVESALTVLLLNHLLADESDDSDTNQVIQVQTANMCQLKQLYSDAINHCLLSTNDTVPCIQRLHDKLTAYQQNLSNENRTARLWLQYMRYINIVKQFLRAERTADWSMHLQSVSQMLNLLAAAGHNNYTKCARLYLQAMVDLPNTNPWLHQQLSTGQHAIRRSDRHWAAISIDLAIEQVMMRAVKS